MQLIFNAEYVKAILRDKGLNYSDLENLMIEAGYKITESAIKKWFMRSNPVPPTLKNMTAIAKVLKIPINNIVLQGQESVINGVKKIPFIGYVSCGLPDNADYDDGEDIYYPENLWNKNLYSMRACGDSMSPDIENGDIVICDKSAHISNGDLVHYTLFNESAVKIYYKDKNNTIKLVPRNQSPEFRTINIMENDIELLESFSAVKVIRSIRTQTNNHLLRLKAVGLA